MAKEKVAELQATELTVGTQQAVESINKLKSAVKDSTNEWKVMESQLKQSGDAVGASEARYKGLTQSVANQENMLQKLRQEQSEVNRSTEAGEQTYQKYATQITTAERQLASMTRQQEQAKRAYEMQESGIASLNKEIRQNIQETDAQVERLRAEGKVTEANEAQKKGLSITLEKQTKLYEAQSQELKRLTDSGEASADSISKQKIALDKTGTSIAKSKQSLAELDGAQSAIGKNKGTEEAGSKMEGFKGKVGKSKEALVAMGATATAVLATVAKGVKSIYDSQSQVNELQARTTMDYKQSKASLLAINKLYADGYGDSADELQDAYTKIQQLHPEFTVKQLAENTKLVSTYAKMSGADVQEVLNGADSATRNWNISYEDYFNNMMTLQKMGDDQSGDISDNMDEYSQKLKQAGLTMADSMTMIDNGVKAGAYNGDKVLDLIKEMGVSLTDGRTEKAITSFSKKTQDMFKVFQSGSDAVSAKDMLKQVTDEMSTMTDKQKEAALASQMWGGLGEDNSLKVIESLNKVNPAFDNVKGIAKKTSDQLKESNPFELMKRSAEESVKSISLNAGETKKFKSALKPLQKSMENLVKTAVKELPKIIQTLTPIIDFMATHTKTMAVMGTTIASAFIFTKAITGVTSLVTTFKDLNKVGKIMMAGGGIIGVLILVTSALVDLYQHNKKFRDFVNGLAKSVADFAKDFAKWFGKAIDAVVDFVKAVGKWFGEAWKTISDFFKKVINFIKNDWKELLLLIVNPFAGAFALIYKHNDKFRDNVKKLVKDVADFFKGIGKSIGSGVDAISDWFKGLAKGFQKGWDAFLKLAIKIAKGFGRAMIIALAFPVGLAMIITKPLIKPLQNIFNTLIKWIKSAWNGLTKFLKVIWTPVQKVWISAWNAISKFFVATWKLISKAFKRYLNQIKKDLTTVLGFITKTWNKVWKAVSDFFSKTWTVIKKTLVSSLDYIVKLWNKTWNAVSKTFRNIWNGIKKFFKPIIDWLQSIISTTVNAISRTWNKTWKSISSFFSDTWNGMKKFGHDSIWSIKNTFDDVLGKIGSAFSNTWKGIKSGFSDMWAGMKQLAGDGINAVIKIPNTGIDGINDLIHDFGGPKHAIGKIPKVKFANGTGAIKNLTHAVLNDGNDSPATGNKEMLIHPNGATELVQGHNTERLLLPGTEVLNASETAMLMRMQGITHFASGTGFWSRLWGGVTDVAGNAWSGLKNGVKKFTKMFEFITNAVAHPVKTLESKLSLKTAGLDSVYKDFGGAFFGKVKGQAKDWWKTLWSMASDASSAGADGGMKGDDYKYKNRVADSNPPDEWGYFIKECVSFVASRLANSGVPASKFSHLGNGMDWVNASVPHMSKPKVGSVAVYGPGSEFGNHVAMVTGVQGNKISGEEYNWSGDHKYHTYHGRNASGATTFLDFGLGDGSSKSETKADSPLAKLIKKQTGGMLGWIQKFIAPLNDSSTGVDGDVHSWADDVKKALRKLNLSDSASMVQKVLRQIQTESGGNPKAIQGNIGDINNRTGNLAKGLMQVIPPTFNAYALPGHKDIFNGYDNILAGLNYAKHRYGSDLSYLGQGHGYENGGFISSHGLYEIAERNMPEVVIPLDPAKKPRATELLAETTARINGNQVTETASQTDLSRVERKLDNMISLLSQLVTGQGSQVVQAIVDRNDLYRKQANDVNLRGYQSLI